MIERKIASGNFLANEMSIVYTKINGQKDQHDKNRLKNINTIPQIIIMIPRK